MQRRCGELGIDRGERDTLPLCDCLDLAPSFRDPFVEWKETARETDAQIVIEPALKCASPRLIFAEQVNPFSNLSDGNDAEMHQFLGGRDDPIGNRARGPRLHQL